MLRYLHKEELVLSDEKSVDLCLDVYNLSHKYQLKRLSECLETHIRTNLINKDNFVDIYVFANERNFENLCEISKNFMFDKINDWVDQDVDRLKELNRKTQDSLFGVIVDKYVKSRYSFNSIYNVHGQVSIQHNYTQYVWNGRTFLKDCIPFNPWIPETSTQLLFWFSWFVDLLYKQQNGWNKYYYIILLNNIILSNHSKPFNDLKIETNLKIVCCICL